MQSTPAGVPEPGDAPEVRVTDAEREALVALLRRHVGEGTITLDEFSDRTGLAYGARTRGDLQGLTADLPELPGTTPAIAGPDSPPMRPSKARKIIAVMSGQRRRGRWRVSERTTAFAFWGSVQLDLRGAVIESPEITINAIAVMGGVDIVVPEGIPVELEGFMLMGGRDERIRDVPPLPGAPLVRVRAHGMWGGVAVRSKPPRRSDPELDAGERRELLARNDLFDDVADRIEQHMDRVRDRAEQMAERAQQRAEQQAERARQRAERHAGGWAAPPPPRRPRAGRQPIQPEQPPQPQPPQAAPAEQPSGVERVAEGLAQPPEDATPLPPTAPDGTLTILFTDIEGSATLAERLGDQRWIGVLQTHNALVREQVALHGGTELKAQGDGFLIVFSSARRALLCAIGIQRAMAAYRQGHPDTPVAIRIGLHTGEVVRAGGDVFGKNVILAARIAAQAQGGEILASSIVKELTDSAGDLGFDGGRDVELKGLSRPYKVHVVDWAP
jgi:class 3 adenylate cyclase